VAIFMMLLFVLFTLAWERLKLHKTVCKKCSI
jgi:hypothetical protein